MEQHGGKSETIVGVSTSGWSSLQNDRSARLSCKTTRQREGLGEVSWNHHDSKPKEEWSHSLIKRQVRRADQALLPTLAHSFVACGRARVPHAPACKEWWWKTLCPGVDTHTYTHTRTPVIDTPRPQSNAAFARSSSHSSDWHLSQSNGSFCSDWHPRGLLYIYTPQVPIQSAHRHNQDVVSHRTTPHTLMHATCHTTA